MTLALAPQGIDVRQTSTALVFRASLKNSAGTKVTAGTINLFLMQLMSDGSLQQYDFDANTFSSSPPSAAYEAMNYQQPNGQDTGIWTYALTTLTGFTLGGVYIAQVSDQSGTPTAVPVDQEREFQFGSGQGDLTIDAGGNQQTAWDQLASIPVMCVAGDPASPVVMPSVGSELPSWVVSGAAYPTLYWNATAKRWTYQSSLGILYHCIGSPLGSTTWYPDGGGENQAFELAPRYDGSGSIFPDAGQNLRVLAAQEFTLSFHTQNPSSSPAIPLAIDSDYNGGMPYVTVLQNGSPVDSTVFGLYVENPGCWGIVVNPTNYDPQQDSVATSAPNRYDVQFTPNSDQAGLFQIVAIAQVNGFEDCAVIATVQVGPVAAAATNLPDDYLSSEERLQLAVLTSDSIGNAAIMGAIGSPATSTQASAILTAVQAIPTAEQNQSGVATSSALASVATSVGTLLARFCGTQGKVVLDNSAGTITVYESDNKTILFQQAFTTTATSQTVNAQS